MALNVAWEEERVLLLGFFLVDEEEDEELVLVFFVVLLLGPAAASVGSICPSPSPATSDLFGSTSSIDLLFVPAAAAASACLLTRSERCLLLVRKLGLGLAGAAIALASARMRVAWREGVRPVDAEPVGRARAA